MLRVVAQTDVARMQHALVSDGRNHEDQHVTRHHPVRNRLFEILQRLAAQPFRPRLRVEDSRRYADAQRALRNPLTGPIEQLPRARRDDAAEHGPRRVRLLEIARWRRRQCIRRRRVGRGEIGRGAEARRRRTRRTRGGCGGVFGGEHVVGRSDEFALNRFTRQRRRAMSGRNFAPANRARVALMNRCLLLRGGSRGGTARLGCVALLGGPLDDRRNGGRAFGVVGR